MSSPGLIDVYPQTEADRLAHVAGKVAERIRADPSLVHQHLPPSKWETCELLGYPKYKPPYWLLEPVPTVDLGYLGTVCDPERGIFLRCKSCHQTSTRDLFYIGEKMPKCEPAPRIRLDCWCYGFGVQHPTKPAGVMIRHWSYGIFTGQCERCMTIHHGYATLDR